jgi:hypothetical protein
MSRVVLLVRALGSVAAAHRPSAAEDPPPKSRLPEARAVLEKAAEWDILSLDPHEQKTKPKDEFHGWKVLGKLTVKDADTRARLLKALDKGIAEDVAQKKKEEEMGLLTRTGCFQPRHGIRATHDSKTADFLICFECKPIYVYFAGGKEVIYTTESPQDAFDDVLKKADVPLGPRLFKKK